MSTNNILVFIEQRNGKILPASFQLLALADELAKTSGGQAEACVVRENVGGLIDGIAAQGAKKIYTVDDAELSMYRPGPYTTALTAAIDTGAPRIPRERSGTGDYTRIAGPRAGEPQSGPRGPGTSGRPSRCIGRCICI